MKTDEYALAYQQMYRDNNREAIKESNRRYYLKNKAKIRANRVANKEHIRAYQKAYYKL